METRLGRLVRRPDGRPEMASGGRHVSIAHDGALVLAVSAADAPGCDLQACEPRSADDWSRLLGGERMQLALFLESHGDPLNVAATRVWCAAECLAKAGLSRDTRLAHGGALDGWLTLSADGALILTRAFRVRDASNPLMVAALLNGARAAKLQAVSRAAV